MGIIDGILSPVLAIINKVIPDPEKQAEIALQMASLQQSAQFKEIDAQLAMVQTQTDTNKAEAANQSLFVAGWRPFIGWICGIGLGWNYLGLSFVTTMCKLFGHPVDIPPMDLSEMMPLLMGMLGLGGMRTVEKIKGVNSGH